ncbi:30S ribosomal protein S17e [Candidatus Pacearchaeota archaeon]|nr:30S ribosomal protein S17e [Candidatus Pacearchaeota archaeon]
MGRIKSAAIKRAARILSGKRPGFSSSFEGNKMALKNTELPDKSTKNKIAGYITRMKRYEEQKTKILKNPVNVQ